MASLQQIKKSGRWHCRFRFCGEHITVSFGQVSAAEALGRKASLELRLMRIKQGCPPTM